MTRARPIRLSHVERLLAMLSERDWAIIEDVDRLRLVSGAQIERLHFATFSSAHSRSVKRGHVLKRLVNARVLVPFERRIGAPRGGSDVISYALDSGGLQLMRLRANAEGRDRPVRRPRLPGERFVAHTLAVSELYVSLIERSRIGRFALDNFPTESAAAVRDGLGGWLKPDAFVKLRLDDGNISDYWWVEVDLATESLPTIRAKLRAYLDFVERGQLGPEGVVPRVIVGVPDERRRVAVQREVNTLPTLAGYLFRVTELANMAIAMEQTLVESL